MKILIFTQYFWPENFIINDLAVNLNKSYKIEVLTGKPNYPRGNYYNGYGFFKKNKEIFQNILIHRVPMIPRYKATKLNLFISWAGIVVVRAILLKNEIFFPSLTL